MIQHSSRSTLQRLITPPQGRFDIRFNELWEYRELGWLMCKRNIFVRYRQMALGFLWIILEPLTLLTIMVAVFGHILRLPSNGYPYPLYVYAALLPWLLFSKVTQSVASSLQTNMAMVSKVYFPRLLLPLSVLLRDLFDHLIALLILLGMKFYYGYPFTSSLFILPVSMLIATMTGVGIGLWVAGAVVRYRDLLNVLTILLQLGMYASPIMYSASIVPTNLQGWYQLNPLYWAIEFYRFAMLDQSISLTISFYGALTISVGLFISGIWVFTRIERIAVDIQ